MHEERLTHAAVTRSRNPGRSHEALAVHVPQGPETDGVPYDAKLIPVITPAEGAHSCAWELVSHCSLSRVGFNLTYQPDRYAISLR